MEGVFHIGIWVTNSQSMVNQPSVNMRIDCYFLLDLTEYASFQWLFKEKQSFQTSKPTKIGVSHFHANPNSKGNLWALPRLRWGRYVSTRRVPTKSKGHWHVWIRHAEAKSCWSRFRNSTWSMINYTNHMDSLAISTYTLGTIMMNGNHHRPIITIEDISYSRTIEILWYCEVKRPSSIAEAPRRVGRRGNKRRWRCALRKLYTGIQLQWDWSFIGIYGDFNEI